MFFELMEDVKTFQYDEQAVVEEGASQSGLVVQAALQIVVQIERGGMVQRRAVGQGDALLGVSASPLQISVLEVEGGVVVLLTTVVAIRA